MVNNEWVRVSDDTSPRFICKKIKYVPKESTVYLSYKSGEISKIHNIPQDKFEAICKDLDYQNIASLCCIHGVAVI
ncbi:hypothetical protein [Vibrio sp. Vb0587]|uniref:hypothetical protein n=1 Tax=Vibrio sp. Vb0587 TaxID=3074626 RepID=UPI002964079E|nr:hypothetical protein [Vibrio sp. Vb0587]MDW1965985.1 hypothetical protein [Vibrio sp. Vb0587]